MTILSSPLFRGLDEGSGNAGDGNPPVWTRLCRARRNFD
jgi:hypothetical protein